MTRMRFCTPEGIMEFKAKGKLSNAPAGHLPWFDARTGAVPRHAGHRPLVGTRPENHAEICWHWTPAVCGAVI
jgi:hypothetical protein